MDLDKFMEFHNSYGPKGLKIELEGPKYKFFIGILYYLTQRGL